MNDLGLTTRESYASSLYVIEEFSAIGTCEKQEDATGCLIEGNTSVMVLCDGIGGLERGDLAAKTAVNTILRCASGYIWRESPIEFLRYLIAVANEAVFQLVDESGIPIQGGCTLVIVLTVGRRLYLANVGDSRAYLIKKDGMRQLTQDHNLSEQLKRQLKSGEISQEEYNENISRGMMLTSYLGMGELKESFICSDPLVLDRDEIVLIESDGLYKLVSNEETEKILKNNVRMLGNGGNELLQCAKNSTVNYQDNTSIILFRIK